MNEKKNETWRASRCWPRQVMGVTTGTAAALLLGAEAALRGAVGAAAHDLQVARVARAVEREVPREDAAVVAQVRRCAPLVMDEDDHGLRAARCHIAPSEVEKSRRRL